MKIDLSDLQRDFQIKTVNQNSDTKFDLDLKVSDLGTTKENTKHDLTTKTNYVTIICSFVYCTKNCG